MILGIDASALRETRAAGAKFTVGGKPIEPLSYLHDENGVSILRLRLWVDPYDEKGHPYGGGTNDLETFVLLAKEGLEKGYKLLMDFHYSDFWCDPAKQCIPKSWRRLSFLELVAKVGEYTRKTLTYLKNEGIDLYAIQIGNEITNGMLWPLGKLEGEPGSKRQNYDSLCAFLHQGLMAANDIYPKAKTMIHLERSYDQAVYREFFDNVLEAGLNFDIIGMSYYPYWHGSFDKLFANVDLMRKTYGKPIWIVETSYSFTTEKAYVDAEGWNPLVNNELATVESCPYPPTQEGQEQFLTTLMEKAKQHKVEAIVYWEPLWLPLSGLTWATKEGEEYVHETHKPTHNEWANQCLFDYHGEATKALYAFKAE